MNHRHPAWMGIGILIGMLAVCPAARAEDGSWAPWTGNNAPPPSASASPSARPTSPLVYDMAPVTARAAVAEAQYDRAIADFAAITAGLRRQFENSSQYVSAQRELDSARSAYNDAVAPLKDALLRDPKYHGLVEKRTQMEIALSDPGLDSDQRLDLATRKMQYSTVVGQMENNAIDNDPVAHDAKIRLAAAQQAFTDLKSNFEASLDSQPELVAARRNLDNARTNAIGADAYLDGAWITRADTIDALHTQYAPQPAPNPNYYWPYVYAGYPWWGWGGGIVVIQRSGYHWNSPKAFASK
jgi:hypothetical protein